MRLLIISDDMKIGKITGGNVRLRKLIKYFYRNHKDVYFEIFTPFISEKDKIKLPNCTINYLESKIYLRIIKLFEKRNNLIKKIIWKVLTYPGTTDYLWIHKAFPGIHQEKNKNNYDIIFLQVPSYLNVIYGSILKKRLNIPVVYDLRDDFTFLTQAPLKSVIEGILERRMIKQGNKIVCVTLASLNKLKKKYSNFSQKFTYIPNGFDYDDISLVQFNKKKSTNQMKNIVYLGSVDNRRIVICDALFKVLVEILNEYPLLSSKTNIFFYTGNKTKLIKLIEKYKLMNFVFVKAPIDDRYKYYSLIKNADMLLTMNYNTPYCIPGKLYEYLVLNNNVVHIDTSETAREVLKYFPRSKLIQIDNISEIKTEIMKLKNKDKDNIMIKNESCAVNEFYTKFDRSTISEEYYYLLNGLLLRTY